MKDLFGVKQIERYIESHRGVETDGRGSQTHGRGSESEETYRKRCLEVLRDV